MALYHRARQLSKRSHQVLILCPSYRDVEATYPNWQKYQGEIFPGVRVVSLPSEAFLGIQTERNLSTKAAAPLQQALSDFAPDLIHVDEPDRLFLGLLKRPGLAYARATGRPCLAFYHTNFIDYIEDYIGADWPLRTQLIWVLQGLSKRYMRFVLNAYDATLVGSQVTQQRLQQIGIRKLVCDRYLGVDLAAFSHQRPDAEFFQSQYDIDTTASDVVLLFLGRLTPDKGWRFTLEAFSEWVKQAQNAVLMNRVVVAIAGKGELYDEIERGLSKLGLRVHMLGEVEPQAVPALLTNSDIHVTTSEKETLGLTILEAFAAGIPVIAPKAGGVVTLIRDSENGRLFAAQDAESFGQALSELTIDKTQRLQMGQKGKQSVEDYGQDAVVDRLLNTWQKYISA